MDGISHGGFSRVGLPGFVSGAGGSVGSVLKAVVGFLMVKSVTPGELTVTPYDRGPLDQGFLVGYAGNSHNVSVDPNAEMAIGDVDHLVCYTEDRKVSGTVDGGPYVQFFFGASDLPLDVDVASNACPDLFESGGRDSGDSCLGTGRGFALMDGQELAFSPTDRFSFGTDPFSAEVSLRSPVYCARPLKGATRLEIKNPGNCPYSLAHVRFLGLPDEASSVVSFKEDNGVAFRPLSYGAGSLKYDDNGFRIEEACHSFSNNGTKGGGTDGTDGTDGIDGTDGTDSRHSRASFNTVSSFLGFVLILFLSSVS